MLETFSLLLLSLMLLCNCCCHSSDVLLIPCTLPHRCPHRLPLSCSKSRALAGLTDSNQLAGITTSSFPTGAPGLFPLPQSPLASLYIGTHTMALSGSPAWRQGIEPNDLLTSLSPEAPEFRITQHAHGPMKLATLSGNTGLLSVLQLPGAPLDKTCSGLFFSPGLMEISGSV